jgi:hypothetical protein
MGKVVAIHQPQYLPWLPFFDKADRADVFVFLDNVQFQRRGVQNRNAIKGAQGRINLTVPVAHADYHARIDEIAVAETAWRHKHIEGIRHCYTRAPFLSLFEEELRGLIEQPWRLLADLNIAVSIWFFCQMKIDCQILRASALDCSGQKGDLILNLCDAVGATTYLSGQGAQGYQDEAEFSARGIELRYQNYAVQPYTQLHSHLGFMADLSALDLVLNEGPRAADILRAGRRDLS